MIIDVIPVGNVSLSPCIRGTHCANTAIPSDARFIPVHTGNTQSIAVGCGEITVYPRAYGEHVYRCILNTPIMRFIPVHTGNTLIIIY